MHLSRAVLLVLLQPLAAQAAEYRVGPDQQYTRVGDVPWESLEPGDTVLIHARPAPYAEKWVLGRRGTAAAPITVRGVKDAQGNLPVIVGENATTRSQLNFWSEERGILKIGGSNQPADTMPAHLVVENLHLRRARGAFTGRNGASTYLDNAAAIFIEKGEHITIRGCVLEDSGNGLFIASQASNVTVENNHLLGNGNSGSTQEHNAYTEALGITYQFNRFGPPCTGCLGSNLKDRSAGSLIRYNWIEGGNRQLDLVDSGSATLRSAPSYGRTFVYGNVLVEPEGAGNRQVVHFGGDSGTTNNYRGTLYFFHNTVVSRRTDRTTLLRLSHQDQTAHVTNNVVLVAAANGNTLSLTDAAGTLRHGGNWYKPGYVSTFGNLTGAVVDTGGNLTGADPGFVDLAGQDFHLATGSALRGQAVALPAEASGEPVAWQYVPHTQGEPRAQVDPAHIGAFGDAAQPGTETPDAGTGTPTDAGTGTPTDAGTGTPTDAGTGTPADAGTTPQQPDDDEGEGGSGGCGATGAGLTAPLVFALLGVLGLRRRRDMTRTP
ncbi:right-handed parallel beta-helix repeat-containing protein [Corallococcus macrosporus]|uniref:Polysaccharide-degrading enzyme n=1 Tax=Corallococcus macrosporus DSM 14697 TaxID=1189310 RepID=A0A250K3Z8_9BACT|nr:right-handed parallel beta-helix repeat-containing protein [Corallococcus macrosporus]ATB50321.1 polysaccharide-degrading enzyme [Corallococcus macrosporus DSM 14697]